MNLETYIDVIENLESVQSQEKMVDKNNVFFFKMITI